MIVEIIKEEIDILAPTDSIATAMDVIISKSAGK